MPSEGVGDEPHVYSTWSWSEEGFFFFFLFFRERNMEAGINHGDISVTFLNRGFRSQDVSGLGYSG